MRSWDLASGEDRLLTSSASDVKRIAFSTDGTLLAAACADGVLRQWDVATGEMRELHGHHAEVGDLLFKTGSRTLISASLDGSIRVWQNDVPSEPGVLQGLLFRWTNANIGTNNEVVFR